jgi:hypothetical protein
MNQRTRIKPTLTIKDNTPGEEIIEGRRAKISEGRLELLFDFGMPDDEDDMVLIKLAGDRYGDEFEIIPLNCLVLALRIWSLILGNGCKASVLQHLTTSSIRRNPERLDTFTWIKEERCMSGFAASAGRVRRCLLRRYGILKLVGFPRSIK